MDGPSKIKAMKILNQSASRRTKDEALSTDLRNSSDLDLLMERIGDAKFVLLGEASHGTHEYYTWRSAISKRLIVEKGFRFIAVEGDWPDCYKINRYIKGYEDAEDAILEILKSFDRWPTWMWANWEIAALSEWLKEFNKENEARKVGFYGLDVYSLWDSMNSIINYLKKQDPQTASIAKRAMECFHPYKEEGSNYARATYYMSESCQNEVITILKEVRKKVPSYSGDSEEIFAAEQNALIAVNAENYYRNMISFGPDSWNIRDSHMVETLNRLVNFHGEGAKAIVWAHNTHIGDARFTDMKEAGMFNVGQLVREQNNEKDAVLVGFGSFQGTVIAGSDWGEPMKVKKVPPAKTGSFEEILHSERTDDRIYIFNKNNPAQRFNKELLHRAIGVVYHPENERLGNYVPSTVASRYDAFLYFDKTAALHPIHLPTDGHKMPDTFPFGF
jgi:erythromycin esterase